MTFELVPRELASHRRKAQNLERFSCVYLLAPFSKRPTRLVRLG